MKTTYVLEAYVTIPAWMLSTPNQNLKRDRPNLKARRQRKKKDKEFQEAAGEGPCENCRLVRLLTRHHIIARRNLQTRFDPAVCRSVCTPCHNDIHALSAEKLLQKYPRSPLCDLWREVLEKKGPVGLLLEMRDLPSD